MHDTIGVPINFLVRLLNLGKKVRTILQILDMFVHYLFSLTICPMLGFTLGTINSNFLQKGNMTNLCGTILDISLRKQRGLPGCTLACLHEDMCKSILFKNGANTESCKMITSESEAIINPSDFSSYAQYFPKIKCSYFDQTFSLPLNWNSGCPTAYFPLDSATEGTAYGNDPAEIKFSAPGVIGNGLSFNNPSGNLRASFTLHGTFTSPDFCFVTPDICPDGFTMGFWLSTLGEHGNSPRQSVLTTKPSSNGHGIRIHWKFTEGLYIEIR